MAINQIEKSETLEKFNETKSCLPETNKINKLLNCLIGEKKKKERKHQLPITEMRKVKEVLTKICTQKGKL